jgi:ATP-dependent Clp protease ATP-binding subunit ClpA
MHFTLSTIVTTTKSQGETIYHLSLAYARHISVSHKLFKSGMGRLATLAAKYAQGLIDAGRVNELAQQFHHPNAKHFVFKERLELAKSTFTLKTVLLYNDALNQSFVYAPMLDGLTFQVPVKSEFLAHTKEVLTQWCNLKAGFEDASVLNAYCISGEVRIEPLDITLSTKPPKKKSRQSKMMSFLGGGVESGAVELTRVGRCLNVLVDEDEKLFEFESIANQVARLLQSPSRRGIALIGPSGVGKTAILNEVVRRRNASTAARLRQRDQVWLISPGRVISRMSYLGQWEQRWNAILREASKKDHVLYFDDPIGLYTAGITTDSNLCLADVLKSFLAEHPLRIVCELTAEALSILRRRDRALIDTLTPIRIDPMNESFTTRALIDVASHSMIKEKVYFHPMALPKLLECSAIMSPHQSLPGRAISLAKTLIRQQPPILSPSDGLDLLFDRSESRCISASHVNQLVRSRTGLRIEMRGQQVQYDQLKEFLNQNIYGQPAALKVLCDYAMRALQGLQPNDRPLGVFLFLGPTGVGKTESAKALTRLLFDDESYMFRIDMNEVVTAHAAAQLVGTLDQPDGRLPSAIRRNPNCILLLDEIEKAHPDVLDYLLQVIGEGRLSDARGRTVDFRNAFIIMTSNLGANDAAKSLGFESTTPTDGGTTLESIYSRSAKRFFRPEFYNRIDEIVVFNRIQREDMFGVVRKELQLLCKREGFVRRSMYLNIGHDAVEWLVNKGFDPALGARAIKRTIEREVAQPLANQLSAIQLDHPVMCRLRKGDSSILCESVELMKANEHKQEIKLELPDLLERAKRITTRLRDSLTEAFASQEKDYKYYAILQAIQDAEALRREMEITLSESQSGIQTMLHSHSRSTSNTDQVRNPRHSGRSDMASAMDLRDATSTGNLQGNNVKPESMASKLILQLRMAQQMYVQRDAPTRWLVMARFLSISERPAADIRSMFDENHVSILRVMHMIAIDLRRLGYDVEYSLESLSWLLTVEGIGIAPILDCILGLHRLPISTIKLSGNDYALLLLQAMPIQGNTKSELEQHEQEFIGPDGWPLDEYCGPHGWKSIRDVTNDSGVLNVFERVQAYLPMPQELLEG